MNSKPREYVIGRASNGRPTITVNLIEWEIPFSVWRDVGRLAGCSIGKPDCTIFEFLVPEKLPKAEEVLKGALFSKREA